MQNTIYTDTMTVVEKNFATKLNFNEKPQHSMLQKSHYDLLYR